MTNHAKFHKHQLRPWFLEFKAKALKDPCRATWNLEFLNHFNIILSLCTTGFIVMKYVEFFTDVCKSSIRCSLRSILYSISPETHNKVFFLLKTGTESETFRIPCPLSTICSHKYSPCLIVTQQLNQPQGSIIKER